MIIKKKTHWFGMLFEWNGSVLPKLLPRLLIIFIYSCIVVYFREELLTYQLAINPAIFTLFGIALAIFFGFRNTVSYDRFWEGRKLWGALLNDTRSLARQVHTLVEGSNYTAERSRFIKLLTAVVFALKHQLRNTDTEEDFKRLLSPDDLNKYRNKIYKPIMLLNELGLWINNAKMEGRLDSITQANVDTNLNKLSDIIGGCERIASTPIPYTYSILLHRTVYIYCFLLPFGFVGSMEWLSPLVIVFIAYTFVALEAIADELEDPFGIEDNDLALDAMANNIENTLAEIDNKKIEAIVPSKDYYII
ncbi:bestrophin family protein [Flavobacterium frigidarium]|uniref:bestrophin family protein n=1 Tax=Flavobacterium frigidarium TaxID=99286 RepID=UPI0004117BC7|nr:bestrophin family ion channel [Flavobacterium frigidarium]